MTVKSRNLLLALLVVASLSACGGATASPTATATAAAPTAAAVAVATVPLPTVVLATSIAFSPLSPISPLPTPTVPLGPVACEPESSDVGAIAGHVFHMNGTPLANAALYLGKYEGNEEELPLITMDTAASPLAVADDRGQYCFPAIEPGRYGIIIWEAVESVLVSDPATGHTLQLELAAGETVQVPDLFGP